MRVVVVWPEIQVVLLVMVLEVELDYLATKIFGDSSTLDYSCSSLPRIAAA